MSVVLQFSDHTKQHCRNKRSMITPEAWTPVIINIYIYIYIYTRFQKGFHIERYIDRYILLFSCTCARVHFSFAIVQLVKNLGSTINFFFVGFFVPIWKEHVVWVFLEKRHPPCNTNLQWRIIWLILGVRKTAHEAAELCGVTELIGQMSWHLKQVAKHFYWRDVLKNVLSRGVLKRNC